MNTLVGQSSKLVNVFALPAGTFARADGQLYLVLEEPDNRNDPDGHLNGMGNLVAFGPDNRFMIHRPGIGNSTLMGFELPTDDLLVEAGDHATWGREFDADPGSIVVSDCGVWIVCDTGPTGATQSIANIYTG